MVSKRNKPLQKLIKAAYTDQEKKIRYPLTTKDYKKIKKQVTQK